jgi:hypothetical protein
MELGSSRFTDAIIYRINAEVTSRQEITRSELSRTVCEWLQWKGVDGRPKEVSCRIELLRMHRRGIIKLPEAKPASFTRAAGGRKEEIFWTEKDCTLEEIGQINLVAIENGDKAKSRLWNRMMEEHHYLGSGPLCGKQIRYLIRGGDKWLGGMSFSSSAWRLRARDQWIGWDDEARKENLHKVVCNSRFLILPGVTIANLASHVLGLSARLLREDWQKRYGYAPVLLESFVEAGRFKGTCYRAANWRHLGSTDGRGRQDRYHDAAVPEKEVYVFPLVKDIRQALCCGRGEIQESLKAGESEDWAEEEFGRAGLGDERLRKRLVTLARDFYAQPTANIPEACGSVAKAKAAYRFLGNPEIKMEKVLQSHYEATAKRTGEHKIVLAVQDTTSLNYSAHPATEDIGFIGSRKDGGPIGLMVHNTMAFSLEGTPLGLLDVQSWARDPEDYGKRQRRHEAPIEEKESYKWLKSLRAAEKTRKQCPGTTIVSVADREADIYELFALGVSLRGIELLIRAESNRALKDEQKSLWEYMAKQPCQGIQEIQLPRSGKRAARTAKLEVRFSEVTLNPPKRKETLKPITLHAIWACEIDEAKGSAPLQWMLLTTLEVVSFEDACEKLRWYTLRWGIEVYHRTLKSGCKIEDRQLGSADSIEACLAIDSVVAWRICHLTKLGRETPHAPCTVYFQEEEWKSLVAYIKKDATVPEKPPTLSEAIRMVATIGGFLGRSSDGVPGTETIWRGLQRLDDLTQMYKIIMNSLTPLLKNPPVSSGTYG